MLNNLKVFLSTIGSDSDSSTGVTCMLILAATASSTTTQAKKKARRGPRKEVTPEDILPQDAVRQQKDNNAETVTEKKLRKALQDLASLKRRTLRRERSIEHVNNSNDGCDSEYESEDDFEYSAASSFVSKGVVDTSNSPPKKLRRLSKKTRETESLHNNSVLATPPAQSLEVSYARGRSHNREDQTHHSSFQRGNGTPSSPGQRTSRSGRSSPLGQFSAGTSPMCTPSPSPSQRSSPEPIQVHERPYELASDLSQQGSVVRSTDSNASLRNNNFERSPTRSRMAAKEQNPRMSNLSSRDQDRREDNSDCNSQQKRRKHSSPARRPYEPIGYLDPQAALRAKPSRNEYISGTKNLITKATDLYIVRIFTLNLFPDPMTASDWAASDWKKTLFCLLSHDSFVV
ncbi:hypothetical protein BC835DRAFT_1416164 [Cytidiella melzeri]|nr:hypothetical protein BC835DRAFT_1416164 [Cytidiella melzeri]